MAINMNDPRLTAVPEEKEDMLTEVGKTYDNLVSDADDVYKDATDNIQEHADRQAQIQQQQTDFAIQQIEQQKEQAEKDYTKEQSGAYVDWQKQSNQHGANAEQIASAGLANSGYSESSQVSMYNTYQNRVATARETFNRAILNYDNAIKEARLHNSSVLAEIAVNAFKEQAALSMELVQYKDSLLTEKVNKLLEVEQVYDSKYKAVLDQLYSEEQLRILQDQEDMKPQKQQAVSPATLGKAKTAVDSVLTNEAHAAIYLTQLVASGATTDKVANEINTALRDGAITKTEATRLRNTFAPTNVAY